MCFKSLDSFMGELGEDPPPDGNTASPTGGADGVLPEAAVYPAGWLLDSFCLGRINQILSWLFEFNSNRMEQCSDLPKVAEFIVEENNFMMQNANKHKSNTNLSFV